MRGELIGDDIDRTPRHGMTTRDFDVIVATSPSTAGELLSHDLQVLKPVLLYADQITLLSPTARFIFEIVAEVSVEDPLERARIMAGLSDAVPGSGLSSEDLDDFAQATNLVRGNRQQRRALQRQLGSDVFEQWREAAEQFDAVWERMQEHVYSMLEGQPAEQLVDAHAAGLLEVDPLLQDQGFGTAEMMDRWMERVFAALSDPYQFVLFDDQVAGLVRAKMREEGLELDQLGRDHSRQLGLASGFIAKLPTLDAADVREIVDFRDEVEDAVVRYRAEVSEMATALDSDLHDEDFGAYVRDRWINEVQPALVDIEQQARSAGLIRTVADQAAQSALQLSKLMTGVLAADSLFELPEAMLGGAAGAATYVTRNVVAEYRRAQADLRGQRFFLLHQVKEGL